MDKYNEALAQSAVPTSPDVVEAEVQKILDRAPEMATPETLQRIFSCIDLTTLNTTDSQSSVAKFVSRVNDFDNDYPQFPHVAATCVYPNFAEVVKTNLEVPGVQNAVVAGGFPSSQTFEAVKIAEAALAVADGATEVDVVMNLGYFFDDNFEDLTDELTELKHTVHGARMKVILETGALRTPENIKRASVLALYSDADFLKTSTGKGYEGATPKAAWVMCRCIKEYFERTGRRVGFKAAGGIRTPADAIKYYAIVREVLGEEWLTPEFFRIGASSLADALLSAMTGEETKYFM